MVIVWLIIGSWIIGGTIFGVILCRKNNAWGILLLFFSLFGIGLLIGIIILYNARQKKNDDKKYINNNYALEEE